MDFDASTSASEEGADSAAAAATTAAAVIPSTSSSAMVGEGPFTSTLGNSTTDGARRNGPSGASLYVPYIDESVITLDDEDDDDDQNAEQCDMFDDDRRQQRHQTSSMVGFAKANQNRNYGANNNNSNKNDDNASSSFNATSHQQTGTFSERLRRLRSNLLNKLSIDGYSHKYSVFGGPVDRWNRCYLSFCFLGICTLLPWNFFMSADAYWKYKLRNVTNPTDETDMQEKFQTYLAIAAFIPNIFLLFLASLLTRVLSAKTRLLTSSIFMALLFAATSAFVLVDTDRYQWPFFLGTLISVVFINGCSAVMQSGVFGLAGLLPQRFMQALMHGQAMGGTIAALASIITLALGVDPETIKFATFGYFVLASVFMVLAAVVAMSVLKSNYLTFTMERCQSPTLIEGAAARPNFTINEDTEASEEEGLLGRGGGGSDGGEGEGGGGRRKVVSTSDEESSGYGGSVVCKGKEGEVISSKKQRIYKVLDLFKKIAPEAFSAYVTFAITIGVFPGIIVLISPAAAADDSTYAKFFSPVFCFFLFNFGDLIGRTLAGRFQYPRAGSPRWALPLICLARIAFIPAFMFCNIKVASTSTRHLWTLFNHDAWFISFMTLFSISNGYFASLAMMFGPKRVADSQAEMAGSMMATFLACGLGSGAGLTYLILGLV